MKRAGLTVSAIFVCLVMTFVWWSHDEVDGKDAGIWQDLVAGYHKYMPIPNSKPLHIRQLVTPDMSTRRIILWETKELQANSIIKYKIKGSSDDTIQTVYAVSEMFEDDKEKRYIYRVDLRDLEPNQDYVYQVGREGYTDDEWHSLSTKASKQFSALIFPDSQSKDYSQWANLVKTAYSQNPNVQFFANLGDLVDNGESASQWNAWFNAVNPMIANVPFAGVIGYHELYAHDSKLRAPLAYAHFFPFVQANSSLRREPYYSFDYGDVHFIVIDTEFDAVPELLRQDMITMELIWLTNDLEQSKGTWNVVLMHRDVLAYEEVQNPFSKSGFSDIGKTFMPIFEKYKVDLVLSGHYHMYRRHGHISEFKRSETGPYYIVSGVAGDIYYNEHWKPHPLDVYAPARDDKSNYLVLSRQGETLMVKAFWFDGTLFDEVVLRK
ncbi:purple acid phosphatase family protein [Veillonella criceti]|uniref:Exopolysaccharide biosynthesis protein related to N-acetylglucosamine-1-phosphodiester alpha-N-acetylglucosaminidase n=1 Tax=Veillonella criceti TaxID=103891 RepID=A0A380NLM6_9FIRM|nr:metallophosphoesterase family protein [Veillonella criceti]SUP43281.1 Exopolysaccharide biosynthesis protein related to N-acetylglucosamine-1-phosphodiester alpha-N-acetylglucosaminidase [Veillonella criceti]